MLCWPREPRGLFALHQYLCGVGVSARGAVSHSAQRIPDAPRSRQGRKMWPGTSPVGWCPARAHTAASVKVRAVAANGARLRPKVVPIGARPVLRIGPVLLGPADRFVSPGEIRRVVFRHAGSVEIHPRRRNAPERNDTIPGGGGMNIRIVSVYINCWLPLQLCVMTRGPRRPDEQNAREAPGKDVPRTHASAPRWLTWPLFQGHRWGTWPGLHGGCRPACHTPGPAVAPWCPAATCWSLRCAPTSSPWRSRWAPRR